LLLLLLFSLVLLLLLLLLLLSLLFLAPALVIYTLLLRLPRRRLGGLSRQPFRKAAGRRKRSTIRGRGLPGLGFRRWRRVSLGPARAG
jgi:hypothetical protein